jgi:hypothetical protein
MLAMLARLTFLKTKNKKFYFCCSAALKHSRTNHIKSKIKCIVNQLQPAHVSHLVQVYVLRYFCAGAIRKDSSVCLKGGGTA